MSPWPWWAFNAAAAYTLWRKVFDMEPRAGYGLWADLLARYKPAIKAALNGLRGPIAKRLTRWVAYGLGSLLAALGGQELASGGGPDPSIETLAAGLGEVLAGVVLLAAGWAIDGVHHRLDKAAGRQEPGTGNPEPGTRSTEPGARNPEPGAQETTDGIP